MNSFFEELKRRNVIKAAIAYIVVSWVLLQVAALVLPIINAPAWVLKTFSFFLVLGFPIWLFFSWVYEVTPDGLKKTSKISKEESITPTTNKRLNILILVGLVIAITVSFINRPKYTTGETKINISNLDKSIAVLPFDDMSSEGDTDWFCQGVTEDILTNLSKLKDLKVISRTSTEKYKNTEKSIPEIASELGVSYIVEGSVRKHDNELIITAQLIDAADNHLWAEKYNDEFKEVFRIQQDVSMKIVNQLKIALSPEEEKSMNNVPTDNIEAYELFLKARQLVSDASLKEQIEQSVELYKQALKLDNRYAEAYAELGYAQLMLFFWNNREEPFLTDSKINTEKALLVNPNTARAYSTLAIIHDEINEGWEESIKDYEKALELNPNDAVCHLEYGMHHKLKPEPDNSEYLKHIKKAQELDPLSNNINRELVEAYALNGLIEEAEKQLGKIDNQISDIQRINLLRVVEYHKSDGYSNHLNLYTAELEKSSEKAYILRQIGEFYDGVLNDDLNSEKYLKLSVEADSTDWRSLRSYHNIFLELGKFDQAKKFYDSQVFTRYVDDEQKGLSKFYYHYHQNQFEKAKKIIEDSLYHNRRPEKLIVYAQLRDMSKVNNMVKDINVSVTDKAFAFAILKNRDSMYKYLNQKEVNGIFVNSRREFDPYRKEPRFIEFMKKNKIPIVEKYNGKITEKQFLD